MESADFKLGSDTVRTGTLTFDIAGGKTLTISGVENTATNDYLENGGAINVNVRSTDGTTSPLQFTGGHLVFENNTAGFGGAVGAYFTNDNQHSVLDFSGLESIRFTGNIAGNGGYGHGGGIYSVSEFSSSSVTLGNNATLAGNIAGNKDSGYGGGISSSSSSSSSSVTLGSGALLAGNRAGGNNKGGQGGALYVWSHAGTASLLLRGDTLFSGNLVSEDDGGSKGSLGGAIYIRGDSGSTLTLDTTIGTGKYAPIAFTGNKVGVDTTDLNDIDPSAGTANSIHLERNTELFLDGNGNIYFDDPISSGDDGGNSLLKIGTGFVQFLGDNRLDTSNSKLMSSVRIEDGTFRLAENATFDAYGVGGFNVGAGATLAGSGTVKANRFGIHGTVSPDGYRYLIPDYDTTTHRFGAEGQRSGSAIGKLTLDGGTLFDNAKLANIYLSGNSDEDASIAVTGIAEGSIDSINLLNVRAGTSVVLTATDTNTIDTTTTPPDITRQGKTIDTTAPDSRITSMGAEVVGQNLVITFGAENTKLTWTGETDGAWDFNTTANWKDDNGAQKFLDGDTVIFDSTNTLNNHFDIALDGTMFVDAMEVSGGGDYTFSGGSIIGDGQLTLDSGNATFSNEIDFAGGIEVGEDQTLTFDYNSTDHPGGVTNGNNISGDGTVIKQGDGKLTLTGDNSAGSFQHSEGTVDLQSDWNGQYNQDAGTTLDTGNGISIGKTGTTSTLQGTINPGDTLNVAGNLELDGATLNVDVVYNDTTGAADKIVVAGDVNITGGELHINDESKIRVEEIRKGTPAEFAVVEAGGEITGEFDSLTGFNNAFFKTQHGIRGKEYLISIAFDDQTRFEDYGWNHNTNEVGKNLDASQDDLAMGDLINQLLLGTDAQIAAGIHSLRGSELAADAQAMALWNPWETVYRRLYAQDDGCCGNDCSRNAWFEGYYRDTDTRGDGNAVKYDGTRGGIMVGMDTRLDDWAKIGVVFGYGQPRISNQFGKVEADDYTFGLYSKFHTFDNVYVNAFLGYGTQRYELNRVDFADSHRAKYHGDSMYASLEFYRPIAWRSNVTLLPLFALDYQKSWTDGFTESGEFGQAIAKSDMDRLVMRIGLNSKIYWNDRLSLSTRLQYGYLLAGDVYGTVNSRFGVGDVATPVMNLHGVNLGRDQLTVGLGGEWKLTDRISIFGDYNFDLGNRSSSHTGYIGLTTVW